MLCANNLVKTFIRNEKKHKKTSFNAVDDISINVNKGEIVGVLGPNGAGKTTLLRMLSCMMEPTSGEISFNINGEKIVDVKDIKRKIGYLSGNTKLYGRLSSRELLTIMGNIFGMEEDVINQRIEEICRAAASGNPAG